MEPSTQPSSPAIPIAIICGFAMIAIAIFFTNKNDTATTNLLATKTPTEAVANGPRTVSDSDYIRGNPNAPIIMIEYSDFDCPFCKQYHQTMKQIMDEYGITGKVAWVYRQFPLPSLHPNSPKISEAALCVGALGGNEAFWKFADSVYDSRNIDEATNITKLPSLAESAGIAKNDYLHCIDKGTQEQRVLDDMQDGLNAGAQGTPLTVLMVGNQQAVITGAQPYDVVQGIIQNLIDQLNGNFDPATSEMSGTKIDERGIPIVE